MAHEQDRLQPFRSCMMDTWFFCKVTTSTILQNYQLHFYPSVSLVQGIGRTVHFKCLEAIRQTPQIYESHVQFSTAWSFAKENSKYPAAPLHVIASCCSHCSSTTHQAKRLPQIAHPTPKIASGRRRDCPTCDAGRWRICNHGQHQIQHSDVPSPVGSFNHNKKQKTTAHKTVPSN